MLKKNSINKKKKIRIKKKDYYEGDFLSLGICVRYAEEPFNKSKIVTFVNSYIFINRLPFDIKIVTESVRKLDNFFISSKPENNMDLVNKCEEKSQIEEKNSNKNIKSINSLNSLYEDKEMCETNVNDNNRIKENSKYEIYEENEDVQSYKFSNNKIENNNNGKKENYDTNSYSFIDNVTNIEKNSDLNKNKGLVNSEYSPRTYDENNKTDHDNTKKSNVIREINKRNETYIKRGEVTSFNSLRSYIKIKDSNENYSSLPFSLIPKNIPSNFQIELFNINESQMNNINNLLVEVNVCSGIFGDKQQLPYTYNGYFYILSLPVRPQFEIINATKFIIAYTTDFNKYTRKYISNNYNTYLNRYNKNGNLSVKMVYPFSSIYYTLQHNNEIESSKIALKIVGVQKSSWCINPINTFIDNVVVLPYSVYGDTLLTSKNNEINENQACFLNYENNKNRDGKKLFDRLSLRGNIMEMDNNNTYNQEDKKERSEKDNIFLGHNLVNKKLYSFLIIRDNGSRAIVITENYNIARKIVSTKNFSKIHKLIALNNRKKIILSNKNENRKYLLDYKKNNFIYFNFPNVPVIYNFNIPRITFTWIHRQDVIIAVHLTKLKYSGKFYLKEIVDNDINQIYTPINILKKKEVEEYAQYVFLNSYIDSVFLIEQIHIDHFVKGDIPVILKNTNIKENEKEDIFLYVHIKQYCVDSFKQAPIYQSISIKISPINANIELLVIEQLIEIIEKEKQMLLMYEKQGKPLPPLIATSKTAKNAINSTLKIFSDSHFLQLLHMDNYIKDKMGNESVLQNKNVINNSFLNSVNMRNEYNLIKLGKKKEINENVNIKPKEYSYYFSSPKARKVTQNKLVNFKNISDKICFEDTSISSNYSKSTHDNKQKVIHKKICKVLVGYYKYKRINNLINNTYYNINNVNDERLLPIEIQYFKNPRVYMKAFSSHLFLHPNPQWINNKKKPVYIRDFKIYPIEIIASIRTSEHRISRRILHIVDALPLDTPSMRIHLISQKRNYIVCTWDGLFQSLRISYFRQLLRQSLPSAWLSNPFAFLKGFIKGLRSLFKETIRGVKTNSNIFDGFMSGFKCGIIILVVNTVGGLFQSLSHMLNVCHKLMGGSRPRPSSILDSLILGFDGFILDTFYRPWVSLFTEPKISLNKGNSTFKTTCIVVGCVLRCIFSPVFGLLNFFASLTEGFANTLIGDFERFSRVQERAEFETEKINKTFSTIKKKTFKRSKRKSIRYNNDT